MIIFKRYFLLTSIGLFLLISSACRSSRFLEDHQALVTKTKISGVSEPLEDELEVLIHNEIQPNSRLNLFLYNLVNTQNGQYKTRNIRKIGEAPRLLDSALVDMSTLQMRRYLFNKGFFNSEVVPYIDIKNKKAQIDFWVQPNRPYHIEDLKFNIEDPKITALYLRNIDSLPMIHKGDQFDADSINLIRDRFYLLMRKNGYFDYVRQSMYVDVDTNINQASLLINVPNPTGTSGHVPYKIARNSFIIRDHLGNVGTDLSQSKELPNKISITDYSGKFKEKTLLNNTFLKPGKLFNMNDETLSYDLLYDLNTFSTIRILYEKNPDSSLNVVYDLTPRPRMSNQVEGEYTFSSGMGGFNIGNIFSHRNLFGGAEQLDLQLRYGILFDSRIDGKLWDRIFNNDFQIGVNITVPRLITPFKLNHDYETGLPKTIFTTNLQIFDQSNTYSNRYIVNTISYQWMQNKRIQHHLTPLVLEYRKGILDNQFAQDLIDQGYLLYVRSNNRAYFGLGVQYSHTYNYSQLNKLENFNYLKSSVDLSGNLLQLAGSLLNFDVNENGEKELFGVPYLQYAKFETDYRHYRYFGGDRQLVFRINPGIAIPYGNNSSLLIFEKSFFGGGMNSMRAWQARTLGPGNYNRKNLDPSLRTNLRNLDQLGELKLETNIEYRFRILRNLWGAKIKGATFIDMGNIWRLEENELNPGGEFKFNQFFNQLAIGTGVGLRIDMDYFIFRLDAGLKVKDPQFQGEDQWVITKLGRAKSFKQEFYDQHFPDRYRFFQFNFGIGMPF